MEIKMEVSDESTPSTWYSPTTSAGVDLSQILTVSASGSYRASIPLRTDGTEVLGPLGSGERNIRISAKGTGAGSTGGTVTVKVVHNPLGGYHP